MTKLSRRGFSAAAFAFAMATTAVVPAFAQDTKKLGVMIFHMGLDPWTNVAITTLESEATAKGYSVSFADGHNDIAQMNAAIEQFVIQRMDAIIVFPADPDSIVGSVLNARAQGIPVVAFSGGLSDEADLTSFVKSDEAMMGAAQAELVAKQLGGKGNVALMMGVLGSSQQLGRSEGQHSVFANYPDIKVVEEQTNDWAHDKTIALIQNWLAKYPKGELAAVIAHGPEIVAAAEYAKAQGREEIVFVGLDYPEDARQAIIDGSVLGTINQDPGLMAREAVRMADLAVRGEAVEKVIVIDTPVITKENVESAPAAY